MGVSRFENGGSQYMRMAQSFRSSHFVAMEGAKSKAAHASKAAAMITNRRGASQPVRTLPSSKAAGRIVFKPVPKSAAGLGGGATGHVHGAPPPMAQPTILDSEHVIDDYTRHQLQLRHPPGHDLRGHEDSYKPIIVLQKSGQYTPGSSMVEDVYMHWMVFELSVSDASQLAQVPI